MAHALSRHLPNGDEIWCGRHVLHEHGCHGGATHEYAVIVLHAGRRVVVEQAGTWEASAGDVQIVPAGALHSVRAAEEAHAIAVGFCPSCMRAQGLGELLAPLEAVRRGHAPVRRLEDDTRLRTVLELLADECAERQGPRSHLVRRSLLTVALAELAHAQALGVPGEPSLASEALAFVEVHALEPLTLADVASAVHRSPAHVTTTVRRETGMTVGAWIEAFRMAEARRRLRETDERVDVIGERVGYPDPSHFGRVFRRAHGASPSAWRATVPWDPLESTCRHASLSIL